MSVVQCLIPVEVDTGWHPTGGAINKSTKGLIWQPNADDHYANKWAYQVPYYTTGHSNRYYLAPELVEWLEANGLQPVNVKLRFDRSVGVWVMSIPYDISLMFKLTWGGL